MPQDCVEAREGIQKHLLQQPELSKLTGLGEVVNAKFRAKRAHLLCFCLGTLALGTHHGLTQDRMELAEAFMEAYHQMYHQCKVGLSLVIVYFSVN